MDLHHLPEGTHSLAPRPGSLVRLTFQTGVPRRSSTRLGNWRIRQDSHLQTLRSKRRMIVVSPRMRKWSRWRDSHSRGARRPAVYETAAVAAEPRRLENGGSPRCCPVLCGLRDRCITAMLTTQSRHEGGVEPPQPGLRGPGRHRDFASRQNGQNGG